MVLRADSVGVKRAAMIDCDFKVDQTLRKGTVFCAAHSIPTLANKQARWR
jgi:hypothetical protein